MLAAHRPSRLLERTAELELLRTALAPAPEASLVLIEGDAGVGKTTMVRVAARMAAAGGHTVLAARGSELEAELPFGVVLQLLEPAVRGSRGERLLGEGPARLAAPLFRDGLPAGRPGSLVPAVHGLYALTAALAQDGPLALLVDDAQWSDDASLRFLLYLAGRLRHLHGLVLVAARPSSRDLLGLLGEQPEARRRRLHPLGRAATAELIATVRPADAGLVSACHAATRGNPLYLHALLAELEGPGDEDAEALVERVRAMGPEPVAERARRTLAALGPEAEAVTRALLTLGDGTGTHLLAAQAGLDGPTVATAVAALAGAGLLDAQDPPSFSHPIVAAALRATRHPTEQAHDHRRAAEVLRAAGTPPGQQATHLLLTPPAGRAQAVGTLRSAAREAAGLGDTRVALRLLDRACAEPPTTELRPVVLRERARAAAAAGRADAPELLGEAAALSAEPERSWLAVEQAAAHYGAGAFADAARAAQAALDAGPPEELRDEFDAAWASAALLAGSPAGEVQARVARLASVPDDRAGPQRRALACTLVGIDALQCGDRAEIGATTRRLWDGGRLLDRLPIDNPALWSLTGALLLTEDYETLDELLGAVGAQAERSGMVLTRASCSYVAAASWWQRGDLPRAARHAGVALEARRDGWEMYLPALLWIHASVLIETGEATAAARVATFTPAEEERWAATPTLAGLHEVRGRLALAADRPEAALAHFRAQGELIEERFGCRNPGLLGWRGNAALATRRLGDQPAAVELVEEELRRAAAFGAPRAHGRTLRCAGLVHGGTEGVELLREAVQVLEPAWARLEHAQALVDLGASLRALGHRGDARAPLTAGLAAADGAGARALADRARAELRTVGVRPRRAQATGPASLTPAERRVAELVASGLTNRATAASLFVTLKAVEFHLSSVYRKLGVPRSGLGAALAAEDDPATLG